MVGSVVSLRGNHLIGFGAGHNSGGFDPRVISGCVKWLDASDASTITEVSSVVSNWADKSAEADDVSQSTAANRPDYISAVQNGLNVVRFDGSNDYLLGDLSGFSSTTDDMTVFMVAKLADLFDPVLFDLTTSGNGYGGLTADVDEDRMLLRRSGTNPLYSFTNTADFICFCFEGGNDARYLYENNVVKLTQVSTNAMGSVPDKCYLGTKGNLGRYLEADVGEVIIYDSALGSTDRAIVSDALGAKWGL